MKTVEHLMKEQDEAHKIAKIKAVYKDKSETNCLKLLLRCKILFKQREALILLTQQLRSQEQLSPADQGVYRAHSKETGQMLTSYLSDPPKTASRLFPNFIFKG